MFRVFRQADLCECPIDNNLSKRRGTRVSELFLFVLLHLKLLTYYIFFTSSFCNIFTCLIEISFNCWLYDTGDSFRTMFLLWTIGAYSAVGPIEPEKSRVQYQNQMTAEDNLNGRQRCFELKFLSLASSFNLKIDLLIALFTPLPQHQVFVEIPLQCYLTRLFEYQQLSYRK